MQEPSAPGGKTVRSILVEIFDFSIRYVILYIFIYVPVTGRISPRTAQSQV